MTIEYEQWKEILNAVNEAEGLSRDNVIERIRERLKVEDKDEYDKWEKADFDVNYLFKVEDLTLLHLAAENDLDKYGKCSVGSGRDQC